MRFNSPGYQLPSNQVHKQSVAGEYGEGDIPLAFVPLIPETDGEDDDNSGLQCGSRSSSPAAAKGEEKLLPITNNNSNEKEEAIEDPLLLMQKAPVLGNETGVDDDDDKRRGWPDLTWAFSWIWMLNRELNGSFVFGVMVVYGFGQGFGEAINRVVVDYYWKDVQLAQPSAVQVYRGFSAIPWDVKPLWGLMTDILPMAGYHRRPYFLITGVLTAVAAVVLVSGGKLWIPMAVGMFVLLQACAALSDATIDAEVARKSREKPILAADIQSLCAISLSVGSLVGFGLSGVSVDKLGSEGALGLLFIPAVLLLVLGFVLHEECDRRKWHPSQVWKELWTVKEELWATLKQARVWKPTLYMYMSLAVSPDISEGKFYWYTSARHGPAFSEEFVGAIYATGSIGTLAAVYFYHKRLKRVSFRWILLWIQLLVALFGVLDLILVTRFNKKLHIPDHVFVIGDEGMTQALRRLKWMPLLILAAKLCPPGIEGTFFSFLMSVDNVGMLTSTWLGAVLLQATNVTRDNFEYLWLAVTIRNALRLVPIFLIFLLPNSNPEEDILVPKQPEAENIQLVVPI